ncbi:hypothetical protein PMAYCL1PPCAC_17704 [Pristionchus mayeri]|uniref:Nicotinate phosphoribosyltransferase n=1 Tax=Pristionchus mayeri TaxID=1317129 RepID=A0AAN5CN73_9BILA|nr:hypothetical protein PMAYCL1PPCAC_17704 [Pristionchus mayeri]
MEGKELIADDESLAMNGLHLNGQDSLVQALLTDFYQITMCYAHWMNKKSESHAVFDLYFRKNPFQGEYTIFAGLEDCLRFVENFRFSSSDLEYIRHVLPNAEEGFFEYLAALDCKKVRIEAIPEGTVVFPKVPLLIVSGPIGICQLLETTLLNLVNYASLVATNASRFKLAAGGEMQLLEFGLRRAQGPNGGLSASKYCYVGGFDGTSNVLAGKLYGIPVKGTQAHSFICSFSSETDLNIRSIRTVDGKEVDLYELAKEKLSWLMNTINWGVARSELSQGELASFVAYAIAFPTSFLALIDTYDVLRSGVINFLSVALALHDCGYRSLGVRIDSGDLSYLSKEIRIRFKKVAQADSSLSFVASLTIVASNDINEETIISLNEQKHEINAYGVGTHLVTCQKQPALGCVYKLVSCDGEPKIKLSQDVSKITIPCKKLCFRVYGKSGNPILDLMTIRGDEDFTHFETDADGNKVEFQSSRTEKYEGSILCRHPFEEGRRCLVSSECQIHRLHRVYWDGELKEKLPTLPEIRSHVFSELSKLRSDHKRYLNPTPYKVSVSSILFDFLHDQWLKNAPICQLE